MGDNLNKTEAVDIHSILKQVWGYDSFRPKQEEIINEALAGRDVLALMPTGGKVYLLSGSCPCQRGYLYCSFAVDCANQGSGAEFGKEGYSCSEYLFRYEQGEDRCRIGQCHLRQLQISVRIAGAFENCHL